MADISPLIADAFRDYDVDGVPASGDHEPVKSAIRAIGPVIDARFSAVETGQAAGKIVFGTRAALFAILTYDANTGAEVVADSTPAYNGVYAKVGASGTGSWTKVSDLAVTSLDARLTTAEGEIDGLVDLSARASRRLPMVVDWSDALQSPVAYSSSVSGGGYTIGLDGTELTIVRTSGSDGVIGSTVQAIGDDPVGVLIEAAGRKETVTATTADVFALAFPDVASGEFGATTLFIGWRPDGAVYAMNYLGQSLGSPVVAFDQPFGGAWPSVLTWVTGDDLVMRYRCTGPDEGVLSLFKNGDYLVTLRVTGLAFTSVGAAWRTAYSSGADYRIGETRVERDDRETPKTIVVAQDDAADDAVTDKGSLWVPYRRLITASMRFEEHGGRLKIIILGDGDDPIRSPIQLWGHRFREIHICAEKGYRPSVRGSRRPVWTRPDAGTYPNVWATASQYRGVAAATNSINGIFDLTSTPLAGKPWLLIAQGSANIAIATMNGAGQIGTFSIHTTGTYSGQYLLHAPGGVDPNTLDLEVPEWASALQILPRTTYDADDRYGCKVILDGVDFGFSADNIAWLDRVDLEANDCGFMGSALNNGLYTMNSSGRVNSSRFKGSYNDGWNLNYGTSGSYPGYPGEDGIAHRWTFDDCEAYGHMIGDGGSNHPNVYASVKGGRYHHNGKHGLSMTEAFDAIGVECSDNANGAIFFAPPVRSNEPTDNIQASVRDCLLTGTTDVSGAGLAVVTAIGAKARMVALRNTIRGNSKAVVVQAGAGNVAGDTVLEHGGNTVGGNTSNVIETSGTVTVTDITGTAL